MKAKRKKVTRPPSKIATCLTLDGFLEWILSSPSYSIKSEVRILRVYWPIGAALVQRTSLAAVLPPSTKLNFLIELYLKAVTDVLQEMLSCWWILWTWCTFFFCVSFLCWCKFVCGDSVLPSLCFGTIVGRCVCVCRCVWEIFQISLLHYVIDY